MIICILLALSKLVYVYILYVHRMSWMVLLMSSSFCVVVSENFFSSPYIIYYDEVLISYFLPIPWTTTSFGFFRYFSSVFGIFFISFTMFCITDDFLVSCLRCLQCLFLWLLSLFATITLLDTILLKATKESRSQKVIEKRHTMESVIKETWTNYYTFLQSSFLIGTECWLDFILVWVSLEV